MARPVLGGDGAAGASEEDGGERVVLRIGRAVVDIEHDLPRRRALDAIEVPQGQRDPQI